MYICVPVYIYIYTVLYKYRVSPARLGFAGLTIEPRV